MALTQLRFRIGDFTHSSMAGAVDVYFHPVRMSTRAQSGWSWVYVDKPIKAGPPEGGQHTVELEDLHYYRMEVLWHDPDRSRVGRSEWHDPFMVPSSGGEEFIYLPRIIGQPPRNGMIRIVQSSPPWNQVFDQYVYDDTTGYLYERIG